MVRFTFEIGSFVADDEIRFRESRKCLHESALPGRRHFLNRSYRAKREHHEALPAFHYVLELLKCTHQAYPRHLQRWCAEPKIRKLVLSFICLTFRKLTFKNPLGGQSSHLTQNALEGNGKCNWTAIWCLHPGEFLLLRMPTLYDRLTSFSGLASSKFMPIPPMLMTFANVGRVNSYNSLEFTMTLTSS